MKKNNKKSAHIYYEQALKCLDNNDINNAIKHLEIVVALAPDNFDALADLGNLLNQTERYIEAEEVLKKACCINDIDASVYYCLGKATKYQNRTDEAIEHYKRCCQLEEHDTYLLDIAYAQITALLRQNNRKQEAKFYYQKWSEAIADNPTSKVFLDILKNRTPEELPIDFIRHEFNNFATTFDRTLQKLHYTGPQEVSKNLARYIPKADRSLTVLDLGCGTGLCGATLKPYSDCLFGVDISAKMLQKAEDLKIYDHLFESEAIVYLQQHTTTFDIICAADIFPYFGNIERFLSSISHTLKPNGLLIFSFEQLIKDDRNWEINDSGRFQHHIDYIKQTLEKHEIPALSCEVSGYRHEGEIPINGVFVVVKKVSRKLVQTNVPSVHE